MKIAILGFDVEGRASYEYFRAQGHDITVCDQKEDLALPDGADSQLGKTYLDNLDRFDLLLRTPGLRPRYITKHSPGVEGKVTTGTNEFFKVCPTKNIIGVTGTKGKGTTTTLIAKMLQAAGKRVHVGGNIGTAALDLLKNDIQSDDWVVLEMSNFQLIDAKYSPHIGVCVMVQPEHLNWHTDFEEYVAAKANLFAHQTNDDIAIYYADNENSVRIASAGNGRKLPFFKEPGAVIKDHAVYIDGQEICETDAIRLIGEHNWQNACAATTAVWQVDKNPEAIRSVLSSFTGLEHRLEFVRDVNGVSYYDDSFGTTPETAIVALQAFEQPKVVILGGSDKGASFDDLAKAVAESDVRQAVLIGETAPQIKQALESQGFTNFIDGGNNMTEIVAAANKAAQPGDVVLLSTGCASFGLFKDYKDRGSQFKQAVQALA